MMEYLGETHIVNVFDASPETLMPMVEDVLANRMVYRAKLARRAVELRHLAKEDVKTALRLINGK